MNMKKEYRKVDWMITFVPLTIVIALCILFFFSPEQSNIVLSQIRFFSVTVYCWIKIWKYRSRRA